MATSRRERRVNNGDEAPLEVEEVLGARVVALDCRSGRRSVERPADRRDGGARHGRFVGAVIINTHDAVDVEDEAEGGQRGGLLHDGLHGSGALLQTAVPRRHGGREDGRGEGSARVNLEKTSTAIKKYPPPKVNIDAVSACHT